MRESHLFCDLVQVQNATLKKLIQGEKQFRVPIWQRQYTWRETQHRHPAPRSEHHVGSKYGWSGRSSRLTFVAWRVPTSKWAI